MPPSKKKLEKLNDPNRIKELANTRGVTIIIDVNNNTEESKTGGSYSYDPKSKILIIVANELAKRDKKLLHEIIRTAFDADELILKKSKEKLLQSYKQYAEANKDRNTLEFFKNNVIPTEDYYALKMALFLRSEREKGHNISIYKKDIRERFGDRGANIANLCTAGYFESEFIPLYNSVPKQVFDDYYELAVGQKARALFVYAEMSFVQIEEEFDRILSKAIKYHMDDFRVHGIGHQNVHNIKEFFAKKAQEASPEDKFVFKRTLEKTSPPPAIEYTITITG